MRQRVHVTAASNLGLDCVYMSHLQDIPGTRRLLDHLCRRGMTAWLEDVHPTERSALASHPALQGPAVADDANTKPAAELAAACDPGRPAALN